MKKWYELENPDQTASPALLVFPDRIKENIERVINMAEGRLEKLRPHVKTSKIKEVCQMLLDQGIQQFKCATIAEAEMLAKINAPDILWAYQPVGPNIKRWIQLIKKYPESKFVCLVDNISTMNQLAEQARLKNLVINVYIDLNVGMNRTGVFPDQAKILAEQTMEHIKLKGLHAYDGHISDPDETVRNQQADEVYDIVSALKTDIQPLFENELEIVIGGSPTYSNHVQRDRVVCSPGTFVFWDWGYQQMLPEHELQYAAVLISRVISVIDQEHVCIDLGYKSVAAENPLPRVMFFNENIIEQVSQSEEHMVLKVENSQEFPIGTVLYAVPRHICPTVALYENVQVVENNIQTTQWQVIARKRKLNI